MTPSDKPTIKTRDIIGSQVIAGDNNKADMSGVKVTLPAADTVNIAKELAGLRELLATLSGPDQGKLDRALLDAEEEVRKDSPDKQELADAVTRAIKCARETDGIIDLMQKWTVARRSPWTHQRSRLALPQRAKQLRAPV